MKQILFIILLLFPVLAGAQTDNAPQDKIFKAEVIEILEQRKNILSDGAIAEQQNLKLRGIEGEFYNQEIEFQGIGDFDVVKKNLYKQGDKILVAASFDAEGRAHYYIIDYVRTAGLWWLLAAFILAVLIVGGRKGARSLLALAATFFIIIKYIIPRILAGGDPLSITLIGSLVILLIIIYLTEGFKPRSHVAVISVFISLIITISLAWFFVWITKLSGLGSEEVSFLVHLGNQTINFKGLLLAGIIIGVLGVLDDLVISQVATIEQLVKNNHTQSKKEIFKSAYKVGVSHISSMTNTLFLAYAGASLPLLILFLSGQSAFSGWGQVINNEAIATEIVRALSGSIGLILAMPIATVVAIKWFKK